MAQDEHDRHMETYDAHQKAMRRGSNMSALFTVDEATRTAADFANSVAPEEDGDVVSDEVYQGLRTAMAMLTQEVQFLLKLKLSPEAWALEPVPYISAALRRCSPRTWLSLERHWELECAEWAPPLEPPGSPLRPKARKPSEASLVASGAAHNAPLDREALLLGLQCVAAGHTLLFEHQPTREVVDGMPPPLAWFEVRAAPLDDCELQPPWAAPARDGVLSERFEVRRGEQVTPMTPMEEAAAEGISVGEGADGNSRWGGRLRGLGTNLATEKTIACTGAALLAFLMQRAAADVDPAAAAAAARVDGTAATWLATATAAGSAGRAIGVLGKFTTQPSRLDALPPLPRGWTAEVRALARRAMRPGSPEGDGTPGLRDVVEGAAHLNLGEARAADEERLAQLGAAIPVASTALTRIFNLTAIPALLLPPLQARPVHVHMHVHAHAHVHVHVHVHVPRRAPTMHRPCTDHAPTPDLVPGVHGAAAHPLPRVAAAPPAAPRDALRLSAAPHDPPPSGPAARLARRRRRARRRDRRRARAARPLLATPQRALAHV